MYEQYQRDPESVSESWREYFSDYRPESGNGAAAAKPVLSVQTPSRSAESTDTRAEADAEPVKPIRGAAARIVENMEASLHVPTATSARVVPAKLLEVNRTILNNHLFRTRGGKVSFTHIIGYAIVQALKDVPVLNSEFVDAGPAGPGGKADP